MMLHLEADISMLAGGCTTRQLEDQLNRHSWSRGTVSLTETEDGIFWMGRPIPVQRICMYLAEDDPRRKAPALRDEDFEDGGKDKDAKQVWVPHFCLYRSPQTDEMWFSPCVYEYITLCDDAQWAELLYLNEEQPYLERYVLTADPTEEEPAKQKFIYERHLGMMTITGIRHFCERLHIPAKLDGVAVSKVSIQADEKVKYLRELVVEDGVQKLDFPFWLSELAQINVPDSVMLIGAPNGIQRSSWFKNQPDGPVYFHNYYCGTKGTPESDTLKLRKGTLGVIKYADEGLCWKRIHLPSSLTSIGYAGFRVHRGFPKVTFAPGTEQLKSHFDGLHPMLHRLRNKQHGEKELPALEMHSGKELYEFARHSVAEACAIPGNLLPVAPRMRYQDGWIADFWYCTAKYHDPCHFVSVALPCARLLEVKKLNNHDYSLTDDFWTDAYEPPEYLMAEEYLDCCAAAVRGGEPTREILEQLYRWWEKLRPRWVLDEPENPEIEESPIEMQGSVEKKTLNEKRNVVSLCRDTTGKKLRLVRYENLSAQHTAEIRIEPLSWRFGVPPRGSFYCVMCDKQFVQPIGTMENYGKTGAFVHDGYMCYDFGEEDSSYWVAEDEPVCREPYGLDARGNVLMDGRHFPVGENGNPVVFIRDSIGVDSEGMLCIHDQDHCFFFDDLRFLQALGQGRLCVTADRQLLCLGRPALPGDMILDIAMFRYGYLVLTAQGETKYSTNGRDWQILEDNAVAISAKDNTLAIGDSGGSVYIYWHNGRNLEGCGSLSFPDRHICEIAVSDETVAVKFSDCTFEIVDWRTKQTCLKDDVFFKPETDYLLGKS